MNRSLKIAFIVRSTIYKIRGGDTLQVINTATELKKLGVDVEIKLSTDDIDYSKYDLLHLFNIIRPADHLKHITKSKVPYVVSPIYLDYSRFDSFGRSGFQKNLFKFLGRNNSELFKNSYRFFKKQDKLVSLEYLLGHHKSVRKILENARILLPNSSSEYNRLAGDYNISKEFQVVPNGIDKAVFELIPKVDRIQNQIICVGQIYALKNQHSLIEATRHMDARLVLIGKSPPNHIKYSEYCKKIAHPKVMFFDFMPQDSLLKHYAESKVHALPSWFETTGLSSLEAGVMGCNLVVGTDGDTKAYFDGNASFCSADNLTSIIKSLEYELNKPTEYVFRDQILEKYTWTRAAEATLTSYKKALNVD